MTESTTLWNSFFRITVLVTMMVHGSLCEFDPKRESGEDFHECLEFYCMANGN